jgi:zinc protease
MRTARSFFLLIIVIFSLSPLCAKPALCDDVVRATLKNGLKAVIVRNSLAPVVTTEVNYLVGSKEAPDGFPGTAHAQEHMMFRGSPGLSADHLSGIIAAMGGEFNADTQQTVTQYFFTVPAEDLEIALKVEAVRMKGVLDMEKLWKKERGAIEQEVAQDLSNPEYIFYTRLLKKMFAATPYENAALGTRESFEKTTGAMLKRFYRTWYVPNNAVLVIVGDVDPEKALTKVKELFEGIPPRPVPLRPAVKLLPLEAATIRLDTDLPYGLAVVAYRLPGYDSADYAAGQVLADVIESKRGSLYELVPEGKALSVDISGVVLPEAAFGYVTAAFPQGGDGEKLISTVKEIISGYLKKGFPPDLVEASKRREVADAEFQKNSVAGLAAAWSEALAVERRSSPEDDIEAIKKVTAEDVNRVAREYLLNDTAVVAVLTPHPEAKTVSSRGMAGGKESFAPERTGHVRLPVWARKAALLPAVPVSTVKPSVVMIRNGLRLIVQPQAISRTISIFGRVKNNPRLQAPKSKEGVDQILNTLFSYGTTHLDRIAFQKELDDIAAGLSAGTSFSLAVLSDHFERGVQLLADNLLNPALPESAFKVVQEETAGKLAGLLQSPSYRSGRALRSALYPKGDPALRQATPGTVKSLSLDDVKSYYRSVFRPDMTTIVVIGQVTLEQAKSIIEKYFGDWTSTGPKPETDLPPVPSNRPSSAAVPDSSRVQDHVTLAETFGLTRSNPDYYTLQVGSHVLSGSFYATRLYRDLREKTGLVYSVETALDVGKTRSIFGVVYACEPSDVSKARAIIEHDLREIREKPVTERELLQAKILLIRQIPLSEGSSDNIAETLLDLALEDLPLDEPVRAAERYRETTAAQVRAAFARWIRVGDLVQVTLGPDPK